MNPNLTPVVLELLILLAAADACEPPPCSTKRVVRLFRSFPNKL